MKLARDAERPLSEQVVSAAMVLAGCGTAEIESSLFTPAELACLQGDVFGCDVAQPQATRLQSSGFREDSGTSRHHQRANSEPHRFTGADSFCAPLPGQSPGSIRA